MSPITCSTKTRPVWVRNCSSVSSGTVSRNLASSSEAGAELSSTVAVISTRSSACSVSMPILLEACVAETTTSEFFEDFTSMRPLPTFWSTTTGCPFTAKCFSKCWGSACAKEKGRRSAPSTGRIPLPIVFELMLVTTPPAFHHDGYQFGLLLVGTSQIFARQIVLRLLFHALLAIGDKFVHDIQILTEGNVHVGSASKLHGRQMSFVVVQGQAGVFINAVVRVARFGGLRGRALDLQSGRSGNEQTDGTGGQDARTEEL